MIDPHLALQFVLERTEDGAAIIDQRARAIYANPAAVRTTGWRPTETSPLELREVVRPEVLPRCVAAVQSVLGGGGDLASLVLDLKTRDGEWILTEIHGRQLSEDRALVLFRHASPVTVRDGLLLAEAQYRAVFEEANDAVFIESIDGHILDANPRACEMLGYTRAELRSLTVADIVPPTLHPRLEAISQEHDATRGLHFEALNLRRDGVVFPVEVSTKVFTFQGQPYVLAIVRDITDRKTAEARRRSEQRRLLQVQKLEDLGLMAGGLAHDFNNILTAILGFSSLARTKVEAEGAVAPLLDNIRDAAQRAKGLTDQLLAYAGQGGFSMQPVDLHQLIEGLLPIVRAHVSRKISFHLRFARDLHRVLGDPNQVQQIILNLCINAGEAIGDRAGDITIRTELVDEGRSVQIEVSDTGQGMDEATQARIFDPFYSTKRPGRGLGLAAVFGIVKSHDGALEVRSTLGQGTSFRVRLPATERLSPRRKSTRRGLPRGTETLLVVDDEDMVRSMATLALESLGYSVIAAADGGEGLRRYEETEREIALALVDYLMPVMDGAELARRLKALNPSLPVLLSSGYSELIGQRSAPPEGLAGFLQKPYALKDLARAVRAALDEALPEAGGAPCPERT